MFDRLRDISSFLSAHSNSYLTAEDCCETCEGKTDSEGLAAMEANAFQISKKHTWKKKKLWYIQVSTLFALKVVFTTHRNKVKTLLTSAYI